MSLCPFATVDEINGSIGAYKSGPFRIVHHTTEGKTYKSARAAYAANKSDPHFTVDAKTIYQHVDTGVASRSLRHPPGEPETNRQSAISIEVVGLAAKPKDTATLANVAKLCRWLEEEHSIPKAWPNGLPKPAVNGKDPGGHNRDAATWTASGGHYGHCHVPGNDHWDPGYTSEEVRFLMGDITVLASLRTHFKRRAKKSKRSRHKRLL